MNPAGAVGLKLINLINANNQARQPTNIINYNQQLCSIILNPRTAYITNIQPDLIEYNEQQPGWNNYQSQTKTCYDITLDGEYS